MSQTKPTQPTMRATARNALGTFHTAGGCQITMAAINANCAATSAHARTVSPDDRLRCTP
jgi:hypothetical protein